MFIDEFMVQHLECGSHIWFYIFKKLQKLMATQRSIKMKENIVHDYSFRYVSAFVWLS